MNDDEPYMNGVGLMARTRELNKRTWDAFLGGYGGSVLIITAPIVYFIIRDLAALLLCAVAMITGFFLVRPWVKAHMALNNHIKRMREETAKRGEGWASS